MAEAKRDGQALLATAAARVAGTAPPWQFLREGKPTEEVIAAARAPKRPARAPRRTGVLALEVRLVGR